MLARGGEGGLDVPNPRELALPCAPMGQCFFVAENEVTSCQRFASRLIAATSIVPKLILALESLTDLYCSNCRPCKLGEYSKYVIIPPSSPVPSRPSGPGSRFVIGML
jgi:hypothetical protein